MNRILRHLRPLLIVVGAVAVLACGSSAGFLDQFSLQGTNESVDEIAGSWTATLANFSSAAAGPAIDVEIVAMGGSASLTIQMDGRFTFTAQIPGQGTRVITGQLGFDEDLLVVQDDAAPDDWEYFSIQFNTSAMTLNGPTEFDFDGDGTDDPAILTLMLQRV